MSRSCSPVGSPFCGRTARRDPQAKRCSRASRCSSPLALIFAPSWRRLARSLAAERTERIRSQERADVGAHLHDSVLQTLALIQRSAEDPSRSRRSPAGRSASCAAGSPADDLREAGERLAAALQEAAAEVEAAVGGSVEVVAVGDCPLDEHAARLCSAAAREAMLNAAKFAGQAPVSVYAELSEERIQVFVRDRGAGLRSRGRAAGQARRARVDRRPHAARRGPGGGALAAGRRHRGRDRDRRSRRGERS